MALIDLSLRLDVDEQSTAEVRAWIDLQPLVGLGSEIELPLSRRGTGQWVGNFAMGEVASGYFLYRVAIAAQAGADWELVIRQRGITTPLLTDADTLTIAKCSLVGSCDAPSPRGRSSLIADFESARSATAGRPLAAASLGPAGHLAFERFQASKNRKPQHDRARHPSEQQGLLVLGKLRDQCVGAIDKRPRESERDDSGV